MRLCLLLVLLLAAAPVPAATVHKCIGADRVPSFQSVPCGPGQRKAWTRETEAGQAPAPTPAATATPPTRPEPRAAPVVRRAAVRRATNPVATRCASARRAADLTRDRLWNRLSFRQRSELDAKVAQACAR